MLDNLPFTSMKDAVHFDGPFVGWKEKTDKRDLLLMELAQMIVDAPMFRIATPIKSSDFRTFPQSLREKLKNDPHYASAEGCIRGALNRDRIDLQLIFDLSTEYSIECLRLFHAIRANDPDARSKCVGISFQDDKCHPGLQVADMIAYCIRANATQDRIPMNPIVRQIYELFSSQDRVRGPMVYEVDGRGLGAGKVEFGPLNK